MNAVAARLKAIALSQRLRNQYVLQLCRACRAITVSNLGSRRILASSWLSRAWRMALILIQSRKSNGMDAPTRHGIRRAKVEVL